MQFFCEHYGLPYFVGVGEHKGPSHFIFAGSLCFTASVNRESTNGALQGWERSQRA